MEDELEEKPRHCVTFRTSTPYTNRDNYTCARMSDPETLRAGTIDDLYEKMAVERVNHTLRGESDRDGQSEWAGVRWSDRYEVEFSEITLEVCQYEEERLKATNTWKTLGEAREIKRAREKAEAEKQRIASQVHAAAEKEARELAEYRRLREKFKPLTTKPNHD